MTLENLRRLKEDFSDKIPDRVLRGKSAFKVRANWWQGVVAVLECLLLADEISPELKEEVEDFVSDYTSKEFDQSLTTENDISRANSLIDRILEKNKP